MHNCARGRSRWLGGAADLCQRALKRHGVGLARAPVAPPADQAQDQPNAQGAPPPACSCKAERNLCAEELEHGGVGWVLVACGCHVVDVRC
eukprot:6196067-Pleurochrysis_carterae.AAC.1